MKKTEQLNETNSKKKNAIRKAARWVARMFGYKAENKFARVVWYVLATSVTLVAVYVLVALSIVFFEEMSDLHSSNQSRRKVNSPTYLHDYNNQYVSPYVIYHDGYPGYLYNTTLGHRTATGIQWVCKSSDGDSLACFSTVGESKRGYFNRFTGEVVIPAQYEKAWIFSEGVACVYNKGVLRFINHKGNPAFDKTFPYTKCIDDYCFHHGLCLMSDDNGHMGLIGRDGEWKVNPDYSYICYESKGFWLIQDAEGHRGLLRANGEPFLPCEYDQVTVRNTGYISVRLTTHLDMLLDSEGDVVNPCDFSEIEKLEYLTDEYDEYGARKSGTAHCMTYRSSDYHYGLMDRNGNMLTLPLYDQITAVSAGLYHCEGDEGSVLLDDKGRETGEKL